MIYENFYQGAQYNLDPRYGLAVSYESSQPAENLALALDPRTGNQLREASDKTNTGAKQIEIQGVFQKILDSIPGRDLDEIRRQSKLTGTKLSFHGPLVEASGFNSQTNRWEETNRLQAENQMTQAVQRGYKLNPDGNIVITFHSTAELPEMLQREKIKGEEKITGMYVVDAQSGGARLLKEQPRYFPEDKEGKPYEFDPHKELERTNKEVWTNTLNQFAYYADIAERRGERGLPPALAKIQQKIDSGEISKEEVMQKYPDFEDKLDLEGRGRKASDIFLRNSYNDLRQLFDMAYRSAQENKRTEDLASLDTFKKEVMANLDAIEKNDHEALNRVVQRGVEILGSLKQTPEVFKPFNDFVIDKSSDTFSNVALKTYKEFGDKSPIISIENPPAGGGLSRAEDMKKLIDKTREEFVKKAVSEGFTKSEAKAAAEKMIGATWDIGHINMLRKFGYEKEDILGEAKKIKPYLKHVHLSDNFGMEHTELPMGMGNVPLEETRKAFGKKFDKISKVIETGDWYQHFKENPFAHTLSAFGAPVYYGGPAWNVLQYSMGSYFSGYGQINPQIYHETWGRGLANLPLEVGGPLPGRQADRTTGTPMA